MQIRMSAGVKCHLIQWKKQVLKQLTKIGQQVLGTINVTGGYLNNIGTVKYYCLRTRLRKPIFVMN